MLQLACDSVMTIIELLLISPKLILQIASKLHMPPESSRNARCASLQDAYWAVMLLLGGTCILLTVDYPACSKRSYRQLNLCSIAAYYNKHR